jgi:hypothetical protein
MKNDKDTLLLMEAYENVQKTNLYNLSNLMDEIKRGFAKIFEPTRKLSTEICNYPITIPFSLFSPEDMNTIKKSRWYADYYKKLGGINELYVEHFDCRIYFVSILKLTSKNHHYHKLDQ